MLCVDFFFLSIHTFYLFIYTICILMCVYKYICVNEYVVIFPTCSVPHPWLRVCTQLLLLSLVKQEEWGHMTLISRWGCNLLQYVMLFSVTHIHMLVMGIPALFSESEHSVLSSAKIADFSISKWLIASFFPPQNLPQIVYMVKLNSSNV